MENIKLLLYCCKQPLYLVRNECDGYFYTMDKGTLNDYKNVETYNGKIVAECDFEVEEIKSCRRKERDEFGILHNEWWLEYRGINIGNYQCDLLQKSCLTDDEIMNYLDNGGYAIHIKNLKERIMELSDCHSKKTFYKYGCYCTEYNPVTKAPQNMCRVWVYEDGKWVMYILISVRPEWMCLILNKDKDVEVRKRVLKEMI